MVKTKKICKHHRQWFIAYKLVIYFAKTNAIIYTTSAWANPNILTNNVTCSFVLKQTWNSYAKREDVKFSSLWRWMKAHPRYANEAS